MYKMADGQKFSTCHIPSVHHNSYIHITHPLSFSNALLFSKWTKEGQISYCSIIYFGTSSICMAWRRMSTKILHNILPISEHTIHAVSFMEMVSTIYSHVIKTVRAIFKRTEVSHFRPKRAYRGHTNIFLKMPPTSLWRAPISGAKCSYSPGNGQWWISLYVLNPIYEINS